MICDFHIHFIPQVIAEHTSFFRGVWSDKARLLDFLRTNNIGKAHLVYPATDAHRTLGAVELCKIYNEEVLRFACETGGVVLPSGIVDVSQGEDKIISAIDELKKQGFRSISLASSYEGKYITEKLKLICRRIAEHNLTLFVHPQVANPVGFDRVQDPLLMPVLEYSFDVSLCFGLCMVSGIFSEEQNPKIVFSSLGGVIPFLRDRFDSVYMMLRGRNMVEDLGALPSQLLKKAYIDIAGVQSRDILACALNLFSEDHILFASDYPAQQNIMGQLESFSGLSQVAREKILSRNFLKLLCDDEAVL